jgi:hypothetical protein
MFVTQFVTQHVTATPLCRRHAGFMESAEVVWTCACGIKVRAGLDMTATDASVTVQCPDTSCNTRRTLPGQIVRLVIQNKQDAVWRSVDVKWLVYPPPQEVWTCACGIKVKASLDMSKAGVALACPNPSCKVTRTLPGRVRELSVETALGMWKKVDVTGLVRSSDQGFAVGDQVYKRFPYAGAQGEVGTVLRRYPFEDEYRYVVKFESGRKEVFFERELLAAPDECQSS